MHNTEFNIQTYKKMHGFWIVFWHKIMPHRTGFQFRYVRYILLRMRECFTSNKVDCCYYSAEFVLKFKMQCVPPREPRCPFDNEFSEEIRKSYFSGILVLGGGTGLQKQIFSISIGHLLHRFQNNIAELKQDINCTNVDMSRDAWKGTLVQSVTI